jgi:ABC-type uncharacterized transport system permease subunit
MTGACFTVLGLSLLGYFAASVLYQGHLLLNKRAWAAWGRGALVAAAGLHLLGLIAHSVFARTGLFGNLLFVVSLFALLTIAVSLVVEWRFQVPLLNAFLAPVVFLAVLYALVMPLEIHVEPLLLRYPWLGVHVVISLLGFAGFALAFCMALLYLWQNHQLKVKRFSRFLPSLDVADRWVYYLVGLGFPILTLGIAMGFLWMVRGPGQDLRPSDPKIIATVVTWVVYAIYLYLHKVAGWRGRKPHYLIVLGFALVLVTFFVTRHQFTEEGVVQTAAHG